MVVTARAALAAAYDVRTDARRRRTLQAAVRGAHVDAEPADRGGHAAMARRGDRERATRD